MDRRTGRSITELEHLRQSVGDILATPIGTRVMRRDYGSLVPALIDQPDNRTTQIRLLSAASSALMRWEPRLSLRQLNIERVPDTPGRATITIWGDYLSPAAAKARALRLAVNIGGAP
nr:GPW/gp25 family protein [Delftia acidovorans]